MSVHADFTGDGITDLAVITTNPNYNGVDILPGDGNGNFGAAIPTVAINNPDALGVGDFNGDHFADLAIGTGNANTMTILLGNNDGTFGPRSDIAAGPDPKWIAIDDYNGDTFLDLAVANNDSAASVSMLLGNGDGTFQPFTSVSAGGASHLASGDFDGDGHKDLVVNGRRTRSRLSSATATAPRPAFRIRRRLVRAWSASAINGATGSTRGPDLFQAPGGLTLAIYKNIARTFAKSWLTIRGSSELP